MGLLSCGFGLLFMTILFYFWGNLTDPLVSRMSLPLLIPLCMLTGLLAASLRLSSPLWLLIPFLVFATHTLPAIQNFTAKTANYRSAYENAKQSWINSTELNLKKSLILDNKGVITWTANRVSSVRANISEQQLQRILLQHAAGRFEAILLVNEEHQVTEGKWSQTPNLPKELEISEEPLFRKQLAPSHRLSIYQLQPTEKGALFSRFRGTQTKKTHSQDYENWNRYLLQNLPSL